MPGDNDIGGENEDVTPQKLKRFDEHFGLKPDVVNFENIRFSKVRIHWFYVLSANSRIFNNCLLNVN